MSIIHLKDLHREFKTYKRQRGLWGAMKTLFTRETVITKAIDGISFDVQEGELVGYLGPNGAGKSTTIKILTGILVPTSGEVRVAGMVPYKHRTELAKQISVVFGQRSQLWWHIPLIESFHLLKAIYKIPEKIYQDNLDLLSELLDLGEILDKPVRQLSLGQRMRGDLAAGFLHNPKVLFLDEPTIGMDIVVKDRVRHFLRALNRERKTTVILCSHDLLDIEKICTRILILDHGKIIHDDELETIKHHFGAKRLLVVDFQEEHQSIGIHLPMATLKRQEGRRSWFEFDLQAVSASDLIVQVASRYPVKDVAIEEPDIESIVREIYRKGEAANRVHEIHENHEIQKNS